MSAMEFDEPPTTPGSGETQPIRGYKWIRGLLDGQVVVDSRDYLYVWETPYWPSWYFPRADVNADLVEASGAARAHPDHPELGDLVTIEFDALDHWFEEDVEVFVHPRSPYTRIDALTSSRHVVVSIDGVELANSHKPTVLFETGVPARFYLPMTDVNLELLDENENHASCPYKGDSSFFDARISDRLIGDIAWTYALPRPESIPIAGLVCFYDEKVDIDIDGGRQPKPRTHFA